MAKKGGYRMFKVLSRSSENCRPKVAITKTDTATSFKILHLKLWSYMFFATGHLKRADIDRMAIFDSLKILEWDTAKKNCSNFVLTVCVLVFSHL